MPTKASSSRVSTSRTSSRPSIKSSTSGKSSITSKTTSSGKSNKSSITSKTTSSKSTTSGKLTNKTGYNSNYKIGIRAENKVEKCFKDQNYDVTRANASRGPFDISASKSTKKKAYIQVKKTTLDNKKPYISNQEKDKLKIIANENNAIPVIAYVKSDNKINEDTIKYANNNQNYRF